MELVLGRGVWSVMVLRWRLYWSCAGTQAMLLLSQVRELEVQSGDRNAKARPSDPTAAIAAQ